MIALTKCLVSIFSHMRSFVFSSNAQSLYRLKYDSTWVMLFKTFWFQDSLWANSFYPSIKSWEFGIQLKSSFKMTSTLFNLALGVALICLTNLSLISTTKAGFDILSDETPLILTPYIDANQTELAKALSSVSRLPSTNGPDIIGYSGYLTVNETCNGNLYFFFTPNSVSDGEIFILIQMISLYNWNVFLILWL